MSNILDRIDRLTPYEVKNLAAELKECKGYERVMSGCEIRHVDQAEIRTAFARHEFPISEEEVPIACQTIEKLSSNPLSDVVFPEEIFPREIC